VLASIDWVTSAKQGVPCCASYWVEAAQAGGADSPDWRRRYMHLAMLGHKLAKVARGPYWRSVVLDVATWF